jgi:hypothetical protein
MRLGMWIRRFGAVSLVGVCIGIGGPRTAAAGTATDCKWTLAPGNYSSVTVGQPCTLQSGVTVSGPVTLGSPTAVLNLDGATIGGLTGQGGAVFLSCGTVNGDVTVSLGYVFLQAASGCGPLAINGSESISSAQNVLISGAVGSSAQGSDSQPSGSKIAGSVRVEGLNVAAIGASGNVQIDGNQIGGSLTVVNNMVARGISITNNQVANYLTVNNNTAASIQVNGNNAGGLLSCQGNRPAVSGSGNTAGQFVGSECVGS